MTIVAGDENNRSEDKENEVVHMVTISDRNRLYLRTSEHVSLTLTILRVFE